MEMTKPGLLAGVFAICAIAAWIATRGTFGSLPLVPLTAVPALAAVAIAEALVGRYIRRRLSGKGSAKPLAPISVARLVALAKASSLTGAALGGLTAGFLVYVLGELSKAVPARDAGVAGGTLAAAIALIAGALYLERCCRAPDPPDDHDRDHEDRDTWQWHS
jgi:uncharacterized protein DUF3180